MDINTIATHIAKAADASSDVTVLSSTMLHEGQSKSNILLEVEFEGGNFTGRQQLFVRIQQENPLFFTLGVKEEFELIRNLRENDISVPEPLFYIDDSDDEEDFQPFIVLSRIQGKPGGERIVSDLKGNDDGEALISEIIDQLVKIHSIKPPKEELIFLESAPESPADKVIANFYHILDMIAEAEDNISYPVLEWALRWLSLNKPAKEDVTLTHGDFKFQDIMVSDKKLAGILDWEYATWSDPHRDLANFCMKLNRSNSHDKSAAGIMDRSVFLDMYSRAARRDIDESKILFWEILSNIRQALVFKEKSHRYMNGLDVSLQHALLSHEISKLELEILSLLDRAERQTPSKSKKTKKKKKKVKKVKKDEE